MRQFYSAVQKNTSEVSMLGYGTSKGSLRTRAGRRRQSWFLYHSWFTELRQTDTVYHISRYWPVGRPLADTQPLNTGPSHCCTYIWNRGYASTLHRPCTQLLAKSKTLTYTQINREVNSENGCQVMCCFVCPHTQMIYSHTQKAVAN